MRQDCKWANRRSIINNDTSRYVAGMLQRQQNNPNFHQISIWPFFLLRTMGEIQKERDKDPVKL